MSWAETAIEALLRGEQAKLRYRGDSMQGRIGDGAEVTIGPVEPATLKVDEIVLARVKGKDRLVVIMAIDRGTFFVGDNAGGIGGWIEKDALHGVVVEIEGGSVQG